jgi:TRAP transporter TAXI family solute receptor
MALSALYLHVFTRPGVRVRTVRDLAGLRVSPGAEGFSSERLFHELLADAGVKSPGGARREGHILRLDYPEGRKMLLAGKVDALFWLTGRNNALCRELAATPMVGRPPLPEKALAEFAARHPGYQMATLQARGPAIPTLKVPTVLATVIDRPEDEVYRLAKVVHESRHELAFEGVLDEGGDAAGPCSADIPMHPGALRYWEEAGLAGRRDRAKAP